MFRGSTQLVIDGKGRLAIPAKYRELLAARCAGRLIVTLDPSHCLALYPFCDWEPIEARLNALSSFNPVYARLRRTLIGNAQDIEMDAAGRILLPASLRERAGLDKDVVLVGQGNKFEVWDAATWEAQYASVDDLPAMLEGLLQNGELPEELKGLSL